MTALLFCVLIMALFASVPIGVSLLFAVMVYLLLSGNTIYFQMVIPRMFTAVDNFSFLAVPCFILAGNLMVRGGISKRLIKFIMLLLGRTPASLANITVGASAFFGAISGSNAAPVAAIGGIMIPEMQKKGYPAEAAGAIAASAGTLGVIIPPSVPMVTYAIIGSVSVTTMFMAGFVPGILLCIVLMSMNIMLNANYEVEKVPKPTFKEVIIALKEASLALLMPIIILGGIYGGVCTPTEAAAVSCLYGFIVSVFIYKEITLKECVPILISSGITASAILFVVGASTPFQWIMSSQGIAAKMAADIVSLFSNRIVILLVINVILLFLGCFLETSAIMLLTVPVLQPIASAIGLDQIALGLIVVVNTSLGMITPPMAVCLFVAAGISKTSIEKISRKIIPFLIAELGVLAVITYFPDIVLILPRLLLGYKG